MKRKIMPNANLEARFQKEKIGYKQLNYLMGGDENGGQPGTDPWPKP